MPRYLLFMSRWATVGLHFHATRLVFFTFSSSSCVHVFSRYTVVVKYDYLAGCLLYALSASDKPCPALPRKHREPILCICFVEHPQPNHASNQPRLCIPRLTDHRITITITITNALNHINPRGRFRASICSPSYYARVHGEQRRCCLGSNQPPEQRRVRPSNAT